MMFCGADIPSMVYRMIAQPRNKIGKQLLVTIAPFRVILDGEGERIITEPHLLDDVIGGAPGFDLETVAEFIERLMMRTVDLIETMRGGAIGPQRLDIVVLHFRRVVPLNIEVERPAERDIEKLHAFADGEDRQLPF